MHDLSDIVADGNLPTPYDDASLLQRYQAAGGDLRETIYLSLGETWSRAAPGLRAALASDLAPHCHGYILSPYGLPALHRALRTYLTTGHDLADVAGLGTDYDVAVSQNSTRNAMFHFGRLLREEAEQAGDGRPMAIASSPGWDYPGVFQSLGYEMRRFPLSPRMYYQPDPQEVEQQLRQARADTTGPVLLAINAQHNPTGANWSPRAVRAMIRAAHEVGASLLIDDAYYAVHNPTINPTNTLRILLEELQERPAGRSPRWLAVRSLGKQFHCNGWGIGALTAAPDTLTQILARLQPQYSYTSAVPLQAAMAAWIQDPASDDYLARQRAEYAAKRAEVARRLSQDLGYPDSAFFPGECGAFLLMRVPPWYEETPHAVTTDYRRYCLSRAGVLFGEAHMTTPGQPLNDSQGYLRLYLGPRQPTLTEALDRLRTAGLTWNGPGTAATAPTPPTLEEM